MPKYSFDLLNEQDEQDEQDSRDVEFALTITLPAREFCLALQDGLVSVIECCQNALPVNSKVELCFLFLAVACELRTSPTLGIASLASPASIEKRRFAALVPSSATDLAISVDAFPSHPGELPRIASSAEYVCVRKCDRQIGERI